MSGPAGRYRRAQHRASLWPLLIVPALFVIGSIVEAIWLP